MEEEEKLPSGKYTWMINSFSKKKNKPMFFSDAFTVGGCKWLVVTYPKGGRNKFTAEFSSWGFGQFMRLTKLHDNTKGYVVHDAVVVAVEITLHEVVPSVELATQVSTLGTYFSSFSDYFTTTGTPHLEEGSSSDRQTIDLASDAPSSDDIEKAKHSLMECSSALSILSHAQAGLSTDQQRSIETFKANFDDFHCGGYRKCPLGPAPTIFFINECWPIYIYIYSSPIDFVEEKSQEDAPPLCFEVTERTGSVGMGQRLIDA
ncbi:hypothetical protein CRG98_042484 [Punica granatum]|uniref:MATH domain-containing protein n=1 Tax=Punica granatum TaxID=22663 RepID=A0A2I0HZL1_PUNGR|nr:hypothetical protein CRG98_042484 [Punica granatum]